jgi:hypothetical protein
MQHKLGRDDVLKLDARQVLLENEAECCEPIRRSGHDHLPETRRDFRPDFCAAAADPQENLVSAIENRSGKLREPSVAALAST